MESRLFSKYKDVIAPELTKSLGLANVMQVPQLKKIVINAGIGNIKDSKENIEAFVTDLTQIVGQKPLLKKAKKSEAGFKVRKGEPVGVTVTLRGDKMWTFLDKLINVSLPRVRDFRGVSSKAFDKSGNYSLGLTEHTIFPEVNPNTVKGIRGFQATLVVASNSKEHSKELLKALGMPFRKEEK